MREWQESVADKQIDWMPVEVAPYHAPRCWGFVSVNKLLRCVNALSLARSLSLSSLQTLKCQNPDTRVSRRHVARIHVPFLVSPRVFGATLKESPPFSRAVW